MSRFVPSGGTGGGAAVPTFTISESEQRSDKPVLSMKLVETTQRSDNPALSPTLTESVQRSDVFRIPTLSVKPTETVNRSDVGSFTTTWTATSRSGTPDSDPWGDAYTDATVGQTGVNHGATSPMKISNTTSATEDRGFVEIDLTRFTGLTPTGNAHTIALFCSNDNAVAATTITANFGAQASRWFTESTITQANQPATPSLFTKTFSASANTGTGGAAQSVTLALTDANLTSLLGKWVLIVFTGPAAQTGSCYVASREDATHQIVLTFSTTR